MTKKAKIWLLLHLGPFGSFSISPPPLPERKELSQASSSRQGLASIPSSLESVEGKKERSGFLGAMVKVGNAIKEERNRVVDFRNPLIDPDGIFTKDRPHIFREGSIYKTSVGLVEVEEKIQIVFFMR